MLTLGEERDRLVRIIRELELPDGQWVLNGSGVLVMRGIQRDRPMGDVDIFVATRVWMEWTVRSVREPDGWDVFTTDPTDPKRRSDPPYLFRDMYGIEVNVFSGWRRRGVGDIDVAWTIHNAEMVDGVPCCPLQFMLDWKEQVGRAKDSTDIVAIRKYMAENPGYVE